MAYTRVYILQNAPNCRSTGLSIQCIARLRLAEHCHGIGPNALSKNLVCLIVREHLHARDILYVQNLYIWRAAPS